MMARIQKRSHTKSRGATGPPAVVRLGPQPEPTTTSWWLGLESRESFAAARTHEYPRMQQSKFHRMPLAGRLSE